ncbi:uncharacterized protein LOC119080668 [Bradysia coprophila]|uniref:uncharacterized protein LOC119080668 n=1 Tax=Bradysia coprophila TaxID=38358 RepID=UPI00187DBB0D|nr:uncharacterized protein LOC119080668 [Bradysia coprophila]
MSAPTNETSLKNYIKLQMLMKQTCIVLRAIFCERWELKTKQQWAHVPDRRNELMNGFGSDVFKKSGKLQRKVFEDGDINKFDATTLCQLIQAIDVNNVENKNIKNIIEVRNKLAHHPTQEVDVDEFASLWRKLGDALIFFGFPASKLNEFYVAKSFDGISLTNTKAVSAENVSRANQLKMEANAAFRRQDYSQSIDLYTEAIDLPDLSEDVLAILYSNRSSTYLKLSKDNIRQAGDDAKAAINYRPTWWKSYYRLGSVYEAKKKYDKAIIAYNKALSLDPAQSQVREARDGCRDELAVMERSEHLDPQKMPSSLDEQLLKISKRTGARNTTGDALQQQMKLARKSGDPFLIAAADVFLAHRYLTGMDNVPKSYEEAARLFAKAAATENAEAIYNLAILTKHGNGVKKSIPEALRLFHRAAALPPKIADTMTNIGVAEAQHSLGLCYQDGVGVDPNPVEAVKWYEKSSENGCSAAAHNLGWMYAEGRGVKANIERAVQYWKSAAAGGNVLAMETLERHFMKVLDFKQANHWWQCALKNGSVTASQRAEIHSKTKNVEPEHKDDFYEAKSAIDELALISYGNNKQSPSRSGFSRRPDFPELLRRAQNGSITANNLLRSFDHFIKGTDLFKTKFGAQNQVTNLKMIHHFAESYRIEYIVPIWVPEEKDALQRYIEQQLKQVAAAQPPSDFELDLRVCYISFRVEAMEEMLEFANVSMQRFPNESYFHDIQQCILGFLSRYDEGLRKANQSLKLFPDCIHLRYNRAVHSRLSLPKDQSHRGVEAYKSFIEVAPCDHRKLPECYYVLATYALDDIAVCRKYYDLGLRAEKEQLSCFLPYESNSKKVVTNLLRMKSGMKSSNRRSTAHTSSNVDDRVNATKPTAIQLSSPCRVQLTVPHRNYIAAIASIKNPVLTTTKAHKQQRSPASLVGLKSITFREMDPTNDHIYEGFVLQVTCVDDIAVGSSVKLILADEHYDYQRCFVYNATDMWSADQITEKLGFGSSFSILNPYMRMGALDMKPGIRIDDPRSIINYSTAQSKKCRFCFTVDNNHKTCARCKRVWYCSKECQNNDWKLLKHKLICTAT